MQLRHVLLGFVLLAIPLSASAQFLVWSDEFNGDRLDPANWTLDVGGHGFGNAELQFYSARPENVKVESGNLVITGRREAYEGKAFTSARVKTHGRLAFRYGRLEARIKIPNLQNGLWPAFWLLGDNIGQTSWPACGEVDILEAGHKDAIQQGAVNNRVFAATHWSYNGQYANYGANLSVPFALYQDYHTFKLNWTPQMISVSLDNFSNFYQINIADPNASLEEFHKPMFIIMNLAVGGINFVQITDPAQITAPFPALMYVDYVRLYDNGYTELYNGADVAETGNFGVFTETTPVDNQVAFDIDSDLFAWHNVTIGAATPYEGATAWNFHVSPGDWFGLGVFCRQNRNMQNFADGTLRFHMKTTTTMTIGIGLASSAAGEGWFDLVNGGEQYGLVRDGQWHEVAIPLFRFGNIDFRTIKQAFMLRGVGQPGALDIAVDNVYWAPGPPRPAPASGNFGVFTENPAHKTAGEAVLGLNQDFYIWANTMVANTPAPYEGTASMSLKSATGQTWFGAAFTPRVKYNLSAFRYPSSKLHFALKTTSTQTFQIGMKSGTVDHIGQKWITFKNGQDPYNFVRNGQWQIIEIPMSEFAGVDLTDISQLFELLGTVGPITNIEIDDVCFINGGLPLTPGGLGDLNGDGYVDVLDFMRQARCLAGPDNDPSEFVSSADFASADLDGDSDVDLADFADLQAAAY